VLSRINVLSVKKEDYTKPAFHMLKLNQRKIRWIAREIEIGSLSTYKIAKIQRITPRHARRIYKRFRGIQKPRLKPCGCKPKPINEEEKKIIIRAYNEMQVGAVNLEVSLRERGILMSHNKIHKILKKEGLAKDEPKKKNQRKWVRYERKHSNSLWHADWFELDGEQLILIEDDASRMLVGFGAFKNATAENSARILKEAIEAYGKPKQMMTDHGVQFVSLPREGCQNPESNVFQRTLEEYKIKHIRARVKHPQSNGKAERLVQTLKRHKPHFKTWEKTTLFYNFKRPHMSLYNNHTRTPSQAFMDKIRK